MPDADSQGPQVDSGESLLRTLEVPDWWDLSVDPPRASSFAFKVNSPFSVNIASMIGLAGAVHHMNEMLRVPKEASSRSIVAKQELRVRRPT